jgi:transposase InsO family protein
MTDEELREIYRDPNDPGSLGGVQRLFERARAQGLEGVTLERVREFLRGEQAYTLHRPARRRYARNHIYVAGIDAQWQADLADMQALARANHGFRYLLTVIDVFSKFAWVAPV